MLHKMQDIEIILLDCTEYKKNEKDFTYLSKSLTLSLSLLSLPVQSKFRRLFRLLLKTLIKISCNIFHFKRLRR